MSKNMGQVDPNMVQMTDCGKPVVYYNVWQSPIEVCGRGWKDGSFDRLPADLRKPFSEHIDYLGQHTAGMMVRFCTDSELLAVKLKLKCTGDSNHYARTIGGGFDVYGKKDGGFVFLKSAGHPAGASEYSAVFDMIGSGKMREYRINLPLQGGVESMEIGIHPEAEMRSPAKFKISKPICFYGSSITQGACASRPGNAYTHHLCRWLDAEQINLGFSGNGKGEPEMAELIAGLDLAAFVLDYDHNAPDFEYLRRTHQPLFRIIRKAQPQLPIVMISRPDFYKSRFDLERRKIIRTTYDEAIRTGDTQVYFVDGEILWGRNDRDTCTVDGCHPNDLGFYRMAKAIYPVLKMALGK